MNRRTVLKTAAATGFAASALTGSASADDYDRIEFCAAEDEDYFAYVVRVSGHVKRGRDTDAGDEILEDGTVASGATAEGRCDDWKFTDKVEKLELDGRGKVYVNGELFEDTTGRKHDGEKEREKKAVRFQSIDDRLFSYHVHVSGSIERAPNRDGGDTLVDDQTAEGKARGGNHDDWFVTGEIEKLKLDGPGRVLIDGEVVEDTTKKDEWRKVVVSSPGIEAYQDYAFVVDGTVKKLEPDEDGPPAIDEITASDGKTRVDGTVGYGDDRFKVLGPIVERDLPEGVVLELA